MDPMARSPKRVLIVETDADEFDLLQIVLRNHRFGKSVTLVRGAFEALDYLYKQGKFEKSGGGVPTFAILCIDFDQPPGAEPSLLEVLKIIKANPRLHKAPVIVFSPSRDRKNVTQSYAFGADAYIVKPDSYPRYVQCIERLCSGGASVWKKLREKP
jgi:CheY-like chemotaxis protein